MGPFWSNPSGGNRLAEYKPYADIEPLFRSKLGGAAQGASQQALIDFVTRRTAGLNKEETE
jgi:hypothetical protein